jgi:hypothetical protein
MKPVFLDGFDLQGGPFRIVETDAFSPAPKENRLVELARDHGATQVMERLKSKPINLTGYIQADSSDELEEYIDQLLGYYMRTGLELKIGYRGGYRYWTVNIENIAIARKGTDVSRCGFVITARAPKPYAADGNTASMVADNITTNSFTASFSNDTTFLAIPTIGLTVNAINPDTSDVEISIGNSVDDTFLTFSGTFQAGDIIVIDCFNKTVYNGTTRIQPTGDFPVWLPGPGVLYYSDNATTRDIDIDSNYDARWL